MTHPADQLDPPRCCALYLRRSHRNAEGDARNGRSLAEQETELRDLAARLGLIVVYVFIEREGTGASRFSLKARPEWKKALEWLRVGDLFRTLLTWSLDRADRRGAVEIGKLLDEHADGSRRIVGADGTDTGDPRRRLELIIRAEIAREEVENLSRRVSRTKRFRRAEGRWLGGPPPFGLRIADGQLARDPDSYPVARRIADELLAGRTIWQTVKGLNDSGIPSPRGKSWGVGTVSNMVRSPGWAGLQSIRERTTSGRWATVAEPFRDERGQTVSVGEGVITPGERARILGALDGRSATLAEGGRFLRRGDRRSAALLTDVLRCSECDGRTAQSGAAGRKVYRCGRYGNGRDCAGFTAPTVETDDAVSLAFLYRLAALEPGDPLLEAVADAWVARVAPDDIAARDAAQDALDAARANLARVRRLTASGAFTEEDAAEVMPELRAKVKAAEDALARIPIPEADISPLLDLAQSVPAFFDLPEHERRGLLGLAVAKVTATRAGTRGVRFKPTERLLITWADGTTSRPAA
ncbi:MULTISPECIES: recombinase family protein [unclassified Micromonospora]|uniref:recombinase family protein n=1 Tax=unclassified Micromonospora TaxID=2617518 RepID=UPI0022B6EB87|nr:MULTISPECIES: recombinase family protein [unclassified Micromonospora]MCZ7421646.1 recombinase family protein [Verrucosispora sp. WMMA2121]WBB93675.1 recombinase family protein [Verrucosispora sp. WMMC514]